MSEEYREIPPEGEEEPGNQDPESGEGEASAQEENELEARIAELEGKLQEREGQYQESSKEGKRLYHELQQTQQQLLNMQMAQMQQPPVDPTQKHREELTEAGVAPEAIDGLVQARVRQEVATTLQPFVAAAAQQQKMLIEVPEFSQHQVEIATFLQENPDVQSRYQALAGADVVGAAEYALLRWRDTQNRDAEAGMHAEGESRASQKNKERRAARPITSQSGRKSAQGSSKEDEVKKLEAAWSYGQETGDMSEYQRLRLGPILDKVKWAEE